ncbi:AAA domain-containing protein [Candidatus Uhrbacteria bacterium]|nr:AAA domain-containing protein [Candidatus Uhrbacteria bacterium]
MGLLQKIAKSAALDQPLLLEGEAAVGKSYTIEYLAHLAGREVYRMSLNGQTDTTDLIGKWVPRTEGLRKRVTALLDNPNKCKSDEARSLIESKKVTATSEAQSEAKSKGASKNVYEGFERWEMEEVCRLEGIEVPEGDWAWQDGDIPKQMKNGAWSVLDEVNTCEPQILVRLNALLERGGQLVLSEDGLKSGRKASRLSSFCHSQPPGRKIQRAHSSFRRMDIALELSKCGRIAKRNTRSSFGGAVWCSAKSRCFGGAKSG